MHFTFAKAFQGRRQTQLMSIQYGTDSPDEAD
jgi:hypothetical protein